MKNPRERYYLRKARVRKNIRGTSERPRLTVFRSLKHIYAQIIDDSNGRVLTAQSTRSKDFEKEVSTGSISAAEKVGQRIGDKAVASGIKQVIFDRGGWPYHGRIKALAESARKSGLIF